MVINTKLLSDSKSLLKDQRNTCLNLTGSGLKIPQ